MKILVCGDRNWRDFGYIMGILSAFENNFLDSPIIVIEGEANGADKLAALAAGQLQIPVEPYPANWKQFGKSAGPIRNSEMLRLGKPDCVLAFHNDLAKSKGTLDMVTKSRRASIPVWTSQEGAESLIEFIKKMKEKNAPPKTS